ncbi:MAG TPA: hypothetical protein VG963_27800 [Polyangiaceae bacterium]|nr:hypothetical protein [Polyangiaceae bacterium]
MRKTPSWLERAAQRSSAHPWALGSVLDEFGRIEGMTRQQVAAFLGCDVGALQWLASCRKPDADEFANDIRRIAERFEVDAYKLAELVRRTEAVTVLSRANSEEEALLLAARDRDEEKNS